MVVTIFVLPGSRMTYDWDNIFGVRILLPLLVLSLQPIALIVHRACAAVIEGLLGGLCPHCPL